MSESTLQSSAATPCLEFSINRYYEAPNHYPSVIECVYSV